MTRIDDPGQPYLERALSGPRLRQLFVERALPALFPGRSLTGLRMQYTRYKAGKEHVGLYQVELDPPPRSGTPLATVTFARGGRLRKAYERVTGNGAGTGLALLLPEESCLIEVFPVDSVLTLLWKAADRARAAGMLAGMLPGPASIAVNRIDVLRYRPGRRCVLLYEIEHDNGAPQELVAKLYGDVDRARRVAAKLSTLSRQQTHELSLPEPVGDPGNQPLLLMKRLRGSNLGDQLETTTSRDENERAIRAAAAGLASFHRFALESDERRSLQTEFDHLRQRTGPVHAVAPDLARDIELLLQEVDARLAQLAPAAECVIHGEYKPNQLLLNNGQLGVVDLDRACIGDPAIDVGNFMAVLRKEVLFEGHAHLEGLDRVFVSEYEAAHHVDGLAERAKLFEAISLLRMLTRYFESAPRQYARRGAAWPPLVLLHEAKRSLSSL